MKIAAIFGVIILVVWAFFAIAQLWFSVLPIEIFVKISVTAAILIILDVIVALVVVEYTKNNKMKKNDYIDG